VREKYPNAGLAIIGAGSLEADLAARIAAKPYAQHVLLCGDVPHAGTLRAIEDCSVFLRTTLYDGDSISVREALHVGATVIASEKRNAPARCAADFAGEPRCATSRDFSKRSLRRRRENPRRRPMRTNLQAVLEIYEC